MSTFIVIILIVSGAAFLFTRIQTRRISRLYPVIGDMVDVGGYKLHCVHVPAPANPQLPPIVFLHGASGNLRDQMAAFRHRLEGRAELLFVDRPGHGWSERGGTSNHVPSGQAHAVAKLLEKKGIQSAIIVGHSFGGAIAASLALEVPEKVKGLLLLCSPTHPWPGGVDWHYDLATRPVIGRLFH